MADRPRVDHRRRARRVIIFVLAIVLVSGAIAGGYLATTRAQGNPQAVEFADATISPELADATVLALGEATHGNAEFQQLRLELLTKLPRTRAIAFEEDYGSVVGVNAYVQGGPGSAEEAAGRFGFALNHTKEMAELLQGVRDRNAELPAGQRIQLIGVDVQRVDAGKAVALDWLAGHQPKIADQLRQGLAGWTDETNRSDGADQIRAQAEPTVQRLRTEIESLRDADADWNTARNAATALGQHLELKAADGADYAELRAAIMDANLARTVDEQAERGNDHTLLFAHNGHVDKSSAAFTHRDLGQLAANRWGGDYRVIGTELTHSTLSTGSRENRWQVTMHRRTPLRGMFTGTARGYLEFAAADEDNRRLLAHPVRMASAGEDFRQWQAWLPPLNSVRMIPAKSYDALVLVGDATPVHPL